MFYLGASQPQSEAGFGAGVAGTVTQLSSLKAAYSTRASSRAGTLAPKILPSWIWRSIR